MRRVDLLGKPDCCLCDEAEEMLRRLEPELGFELHKLDITTDEALHRRYFERIPVVLLDGREVMELEIDEPALRNHLASGQ